MRNYSSTFQYGDVDECKATTKNGEDETIEIVCRQNQ